MFYKRNVMVACEPGVPLTSSSKTVYASLYRVSSHYAVPPSGGSPTTGGWKGLEKGRQKYGYVFHRAALNSLR